MKRAIYLDYAAATPLDPAVRAAMEPYFEQRFYNPSATYLAAKAVAADISLARDTVAGLLGARSSEVVFTAGGTEANNLAVRGVMEQFPGKQVLASAVEHESVLAPAELYNAALLPVAADGRLQVRALERALSKNTVLVSIMYANNEVGTLQPLKEAAALVAAERKRRQAAGETLPIYLHTDACQAALYFDVHVGRLGVDLLTLNGGKMYGPKQSGVLYIKTGTKLHPQILGGGQEFGRRSGTENVANIVGFATAFGRAQANARAENRRLTQLRDEFLSQVTRLRGITLNGSVKHRLPNNLHLTIQGHDNERLMMELDEAGIQCAVGSACGASSEAPSHVLMAMGLSEADARSSLRFSLGKTTDKKAITQTVLALKKLL